MFFVLDPATVQFYKDAFMFSYDSILNDAVFFSFFFSSGDTISEDKVNPAVFFFLDRRNSDNNSHCRSVSFISVDLSGYAGNKRTAEKPWPGTVFAFAIIYLSGLAIRVLR